MINQIKFLLLLQNINDTLTGIIKNEDNILELYQDKEKIQKNLQLSFKKNRNNI